MERVEGARLSWHIYQGAASHKPADNNFSICTYFYWCYRNRFKTTYDSSTDDFISAAQSGRLPNVSFILPDDGLSQHNNTSMSKGDNYIGQMVSAAENGPEWGSTAVFITYDDCGCFYDHVPPPNGLGFRNPMVIVSPYAKPVYTDSTTAVQPYSMLAFIQHDFGLASLTPAVDAAYDYMGSFDFTQTPLAGPAMVHTNIPKSERVRLAKLLPTIEDDPT
jgi:phospholipase C